MALIPSRVKATVNAYRSRILSTLILALLSYLSYCIGRLPTAGDLLVPMWATTTVFPIVAVLSLILSALGAPFLSLTAFIGYHGGVVLASVFASGGSEGFFYAKSIVLLTLAIAVVLGIWLEILSRLPRSHNPLAFKDFSVLEKKE